MKRKSPLIRRKNIKKETRRRHWRAWVKTFLVLASLGGLAFGAHRALTRLEFFSLKKVLVLGDPQTLPETQVVQNSGAKLGTNLFKVDIQEIQKKLKEHPFFKTVSVQRRLPNALVIEIVEYRPEIILNTGRLFYVDSDGEIFKDITDSQDKRDFAVLSGLSDEMILADAAGSRQILRDALKLQKIYSVSPVFEKLGLSEIAYEKNIGFTLYPETKKYSIKVGLKDFEEKLKKFSEFFSRIESSKGAVSSFDLNYPGKILMTM